MEEADMFPSLKQTAQGLSLPRWTVAFALAANALTASQFAQAAATDIAPYPLATTSAVQAKPNLLFILDDSGSMDSDYMPDDMRATIRISGTNYYTYGYRSAQCNGVAYDPTITYSPPKKADGTSYSNASFSAARDDGYDSSSATYNLDNSYYYTYSGSQPKMGWQYTTSGLVTSSQFVQECRSPVGWTPGSSVFTKVTLTSTSPAADKQNYANWFSYYRKRYLLMRTAMGRAVAELGTGYRVGFSTISDTSATDGTNFFRDVKDFDATQKTNFYSSLYGSVPNSWTPLRGALSKAGRYFAKKASGQTYDPMQYSCQRNYALLSTDGYWNANDEDASYGPYQLTSNTGVDNTDATEARPMFDGSQVIVTSVDTSTATGYRTKLSSEQSRSQTWTRSSYSTATTKGTGGCSSKRYLRTTTTQTYVQTQKRKTRDQQQAPYTKTVTTVTTDGTVTSGPTTSITIGTWVLKTGTSQEYFDTSDTGEPSGSTSWTTSTTYSCESSTGSTSMSAASSGGWSSWTTPSYSYTPSENPTLLAAAFSTPTNSSTTTYQNGSSDSLADVAQYYWQTDLRDTSLGNCTSSSSGASRDVCSNIVRANSTDTNTKQHMNTFTIGLGVSGTITYDKNYPTQTSGEFNDLKTGALNWPVPGDGLGAANIDDLWHAAVNGRGRYYSALNATDLADAISGVMTEINATPGAAAAAATSTLELVSGDNNKLFSAKYTTYHWTGDLEAYSIDGKANISSTPLWSAAKKLDDQSYSSRKIYFKGSSGMTAFEYGNLSSTQKAYFDNLCSKDINPEVAGTQPSDQCAALSPTDLTTANSGTNLVNYLRGDRSKESTHYRKREHVLGDIINGAPVFVGKPPFNYSDDGYADFVTANKSRKPVVYVASNDGMLHAFSADDTDGGTELWAYIPSDVMPNLYKLADDGYALRHQYFVDGAPVMADVKIDGTWKTIVVGGLNKGGRSYYALDITNPNEPKTLWEFTDTNMGLTYGNPVITKNKEGKWVVVFTSGYNNHTTGDGKGYFYMVDAGTGVSVLKDASGAAVTRLGTNVGSTTTPSGLAKINAWIDSTTDNTAKHFYGGDMLGNVWRFDPDGRYQSDSLSRPLPNVTKIASLQIDSSTPQPITTKPVTALVSDQPVVVIGTGRYLGDADITDTTKQSVYAIRDTLTATGWGDVRSDSTNFVKQTLTLNNATPSAATSASITGNKVDWTKGGWWFDLPQSGERVAINMGLQLNTLAIGTAIPNGDACASGGSSWRYYIGVGTGSSVAGSDAGVRWSPNTLIVGISWVKDADGNVRTIFQDSKGELKTEIPPTSSGSSGGTAHRTSWRELVD